MGFLDFINDKTKMIIGILSIVLAIVVYFLTNEYIPFYLIFIFLIPAIALIIPNDAIKNNKLIGILAFIFVAIVAYFAISGMLDPYGFFSSMGIEASTNQISNYSNCHLIVLLYALFNIICGALFFIPTSGKGPNF